MAEIENIKASTRVVDVIKSFPELADFFLDLGICGCGFEWESDYLWTIEKVAGEKGIDLDVLLDKLNKKIEQS